MSSAAIKYGCHANAHPLGLQLPRIPSQRRPKLLQRMAVLNVLSMLWVSTAKLLHHKNPTFHKSESLSSTSFLLDLNHHLARPTMSSCPRLRSDLWSQLIDSQRSVRRLSIRELLQVRKIISYESRTLHLRRSHHPSKATKLAPRHLETQH